MIHTDSYFININNILHNIIDWRWHVVHRVAHAESERSIGGNSAMRSNLCATGVMCVTCVLCIECVDICIVMDHTFLILIDVGQSETRKARHQTNTKNNMNTLSMWFVRMVWRISITISWCDFVYEEFGVWWMLMWCGPSEPQQLERRPICGCGDLFVYKRLMGD